MKGIVLPHPQMFIYTLSKFIFVVYQNFIHLMDIIHSEL